MIHMSAELPMSHELSDPEVEWEDDPESAKQLSKLFWGNGHNSGLFSSPNIGHVIIAQICAPRGSVLVCWKWASSQKDN
jgi:hypothetical protein